VELARQTKPDLAFLDIRMPTMTGPEAAHEIANERAIPMIILSAYSDARTVDEAIRAPVFHYLVKPVDPDDLAPAIAVAKARFEEWLDARRQKEMLELRLEERKIIERAKGLLMDSRGLSEKEAYRFLQKTSQDKNTPMVELARKLLLAAPLLQKEQSVRVSSTQGTPAEAERDTASQRDAAHRGSAEPATILVVDDEPMARQMFTDMLEAKGFRVVSVARGEEVFSFLHEVDLVLLDAMLPGRDGWA